MSDPVTLSQDAEHLQSLGYRQELERSLGRFSSFAAGFSYISVLTSVFQLFAFGFLVAGPPVWWTWIVVFIGQFTVALCFAELAGQYPLAGSVYQWSKQIAGDFVSWMTGMMMIVGSIVTVAAVAVAWQVILPQISSTFEFIGGASDAGLYSTPDGAKNALILGAIVVVFTTIINVAGVKLMARINNIGVTCEIIGVTVLTILLVTHAHRGPGVILDGLDRGTGHSWGYLGAFLVGIVMPAYCQYGFDAAGTLGEETHNPRRHAPQAILRALVTAVTLALLLILAAMMSAGNIHDKNLGLLGLPYIVKQQLGNTLGNLFLIDGLIAITVCALAAHTTCIRMVFAMARDGRLPFGSAIARVSDRRRVPILPALVVGFLSIALLALNIANQGAFLTLSAVAIIMFYVAYMGVTVPLLLQRLRGAWPRPDHGAYFRLGRWGIPVNVLAVLYGSAAAFDIAWPRVAVYGDSAWYFRYGAYVFVGGVLLVMAIYYMLVARRQTGGTLLEHRAQVAGDDLPQAAGFLEPEPEFAAETDAGV